MKKVWKAVKRQAAEWHRYPYNRGSGIWACELGFEPERVPFGHGCFHLIYPFYSEPVVRWANARADRLAKRYGRFVEWMREGRHAWQPSGERICFMDNSIEIEEVSRLGGKRWRMVVPPHGDVCF